MHVRESVISSSFIFFKKKNEVPLHLCRSRVHGRSLNLLVCVHELSKRPPRSKIPVSVSFRSNPLALIAISTSDQFARFS